MNDDEGYEIAKALLLTHERLYSPVWWDQPPVHAGILEVGASLFGSGVQSFRLVAGFLCAACLWALAGCASAGRRREGGSGLMSGSGESGCLPSAAPSLPHPGPLPLGEGESSSLAGSPLWPKQAIDRPTILARVSTFRMTSAPAQPEPPAPPRPRHEPRPHGTRTPTPAARRQQPPTGRLIATATAQPGGQIGITYVPGGGQGANSERLRWQVVGVDPGFDHDVAVNLVGQTLTGFTPGQIVKLSVRTGNTAGNTDGPEVTVATQV